MTKKWLLVIDRTHYDIVYEDGISYKCHPFIVVKEFPTLKLAIQALVYQARIDHESIDAAVDRIFEAIARGELKEEE